MRKFTCKANFIVILCLRVFSYEITQSREVFFFYLCTLQNKCWSLAFLIYIYIYKKKSLPIGIRTVWRKGKESITNCAILEDHKKEGGGQKALHNRVHTKLFFELLCSQWNFTSTFTYYVMVDKDLCKLFQYRKIYIYIFKLKVL